jgi:hypothetical protein
MSIEGRNLVIIGCRAAGAIAENSLVKLDTSYTSGPDIGVAQCGAGDAVIGVAANACTAAGQTVSVITSGFGKLVKLGGTPGAVVLGGAVKADSAGLAVFTSTALDNIAGIVLAPSSTVASDEVPILVQSLASVKAAS